MPRLGDLTSHSARNTLRGLRAERCDVLDGLLDRRSPERQTPRQAPVAQLDRASDYGSEGWRFESFRARSETDWQLIRRGVA